MPIYKYKTLEEAEEALWNMSSEKSLLQQLKDLAEIQNKFHKNKITKGITRYRSFDEANKAILEERAENLK